MYIKCALLLIAVLVHLSVMVNGQSAACNTSLAQISAGQFKDATSMGTNTGKGINDLGNYDDCILVPTLHHCLVSFNFPLSGFSANQTDAKTTRVKWGVCIPRTCSSRDVQILLYDLPNAIDDKVNSNILLRVSYGSDVKEVTDALRYLNSQGIDVSCSEQTVPWSLGAKIFTTILSLIGLMVVIGTAVDYFFKYKTKWYSSHSEQDGNLVFDILKCFSMKHNLQRLVAEPKDGMPVLNGVRVLSMCWVILGHTILFWVLVVGVTNFKYTATVASRTSFQIVYNALYSVDSFFFLSGFLVTYMMYKSIVEKEGFTWKEWLFIYIHRYLRLTIVYMAFLGVYMFLLPQLGSGPEWNEFALDKKTDSCFTYWWTNLLYINNLVPYNQGLSTTCMGWTWYLANDQQMFMVMPPLVFLTYKKPRIGASVIGGLVVLCMIIRGGVTAAFDMDLDQVGGSNGLAWRFYTQPWYRMGPYFIGSLVALLYYFYPKPKLSIWKVACSWVLIGVIMTVCVFSTASTHKQGAKKWSYFSRILFNGLSRPAWGLSLGMLVYTTLVGHGDFIKHFLSLNIWLPLARLTYSAYLVHPILMMVFNFSTRDIVSYEDNLYANDIISNVVISFGLALIGYLLVEKPFMNLEALVMSKIRSKPPPNHIQEMVQAAYSVVEQSDQDDEDEDNNAQLEDDDIEATA